MSHNNGSTERRTALVMGAGGDICRGIACALRMTVSTWRWPPYPACAQPANAVVDEVRSAGRQSVAINLT